MKVVTVVGTRPEIIRLSRVIPRLEKSFDHVLVHTNQNWDPRLKDVFFEELGLSRPNHTLDIDTSSVGATLGDVLKKIEPVLVGERPDAFLVLGDTNSSVSALMAKRLHIPVYHMEAGNRCFDENVPEETNRRLVDHIADFNLVYTEHARRNLLAEGLHPRRIMFTGSPMREVIDHYRANIEASDAVRDLGLVRGEYFLVSAHRQENVDDPARLGELLDCLRAVKREWQIPIVVSTHPRTRRALESLAPDALPSGIQFSPPFGFFDYCQLQANGLCVLSDSGTVSEESAILGFPAVTMRSSIERPEALDTGTIIMTGLRPDSLIAAIRVVIRDHAATQPPDSYANAETSMRVRNFIMSTAQEHRAWSGIR